MHNIGSVMGVRLDDHYQDIFAQQVFYPYAGLQYEVHRLQTQHSLMGALLIKNWGLRNEISKAVILHHDRDYLSKTEKHPNVRQITAMLKLANYVALLSHNAESITPELLNYRDNAKRGLENLPLEQVMNAAQAAIETFGCKLDFLEPYEENLIDACGPWR
ncbi:MAG: HDOD domain-containing protein [Hydrogenovibrio sp.]